MVRAKLLLQLTLILAVIGIAVSCYLTYSHEHPDLAPCDINHVASCTIVNQSVYSEVFGIPVALFGVLWFIVLGLIALKTFKSKKFTRELYGWNILGVVFVLYFIFAEFQLKAICPWCTVVHVIILITFFISLILKKKALS